ncbi:MAG: polysaccharide deacetylase family protein [Chitinivibrionales bacterium]|nr:polysaccharide deacetylase family protein [Chitinivibrionales bacterium]MBD3357859.1 polysaccharide deacetylase family protein [Chitinivibrionales bacterium]
MTLQSLKIYATTTMTYEKLKDIWHNVRILLFNQLPAIFSTDCRDCADIPVFAQHAPGPRYLRPLLEHLRTNGYQTVTSIEFNRQLKGEWIPQSRTVYLTFDDGLRAFLTKTFPLLREYSMKCTLFVCPGIIDIIRNGKESLSRFVSKDFLSWEEIKQLHESSLVDIQSHGMWHNQIPYGVKKRYEYVGKPTSLLDYRDLLPPDGRVEQLVEKQTESRIIRYICRSFYMSNDTAALLRDMRTAKRRIEEELNGHRVTAFAFPWWYGSPTAAACAEESGYDMVFRGLSHVGKKTKKAPADTFHIGRLGFDWIYLLPGRGRLNRVNLIKAKRGELRNDAE